MIGQQRLPRLGHKRGVLRIGRKQTSHHIARARSGGDLCRLREIAKALAIPFAIAKEVECFAERALFVVDREGKLALVERKYPVPKTLAGSALLKTLEAEIDSAPNRVKYCMNSFVISVGSYVKPLLKAAKATARKIGAVEVDMGDTACQTPLATDMIAKIESMGRVGKKRKTAKC